MNSLPMLLQPRRLWPAVLALLAVASVRCAMATEYGAAFSGAWSNPANWVPAGGPPGANDGAYIGSNPNNFNEGAAFASITLSGPQSVYNLALGYGPASGGTLDLAGYPLTVATTIAMGEFGGAATIVHNGGYFTTAYLSVYSGNSLALAASDSITYIAAVSDGSHLTTASSYNFSTALGLTVDTGSTLTLGSSTSFGGTLDLEDSSTLDMGSHPLSATVVNLAWNDLQPVNVINRGPITATYLQVAAQPFSLIPADAVTQLDLANSGQVTTAAIGNVGSSVSLVDGGLLTLGASMSLSGGFDERDSGTVFNMAGHPLSANQVFFGWYDGQPVSVINRGPIATPNLYVAYSTFNLSTSDAVTNFNLSAGTTALDSGVSVSALNLSASGLATTSTSGNVTGSVQLLSGSLLTLGASMALSGQLDMRDSGTTLNMAGHPLSAETVFLGWYDGQPVSVINRGAIAASNLYVGNETFNLIPSDAVTNLNLSSGTMSTAAAGNVTSSVNVESGSKLTLGANMLLSSDLNLQDTGSTLDMGGNTLTANQIFLGWYGSGVTTLVNRGPLITPNLYVADQPFSLAPADSVTNFYLYDVSGSTLGSNSVSYLQLTGSAALTTTTTANVTSQSDVESGSKLTLGANMALSGYLSLQDTGSTLNMGGHTLTANQIFLGWYGSGVTSLVNRGPLVTPNLYVANQPFSLAPADSVTNFYLSNVSGSTLGSNTVSYLQLTSSSSLFTTETGNVTSNIDVESGSKLTLGANMLLSGDLNLQDTGSTLNMGGHTLTANQIFLGWYGSGVPTLVNRGPLVTSNLYVANQPFSLATADSVTNFYLSNVSGSTLGSNSVSYLQLSGSADLTTTTTANVTSQIDVESGSKLALSAQHGA